MKEKEMTLLDCVKISNELRVAVVFDGGIWPRVSEQSGQTNY